MAKKKARQKIVKKPIAKLETRFDCPVCSHENVVQCKIKLAKKRGIVFCSVCDANFSCAVTSIEKPTDIYHNWIDEINNRKISNDPSE
jgi:transcription elongation factor Elf1